MVRRKQKPNQASHLAAHLSLLPLEFFQACVISVGYTKIGPLSGHLKCSLAGVKAAWPDKRKRDSKIDNIRLFVFFMAHHWEKMFIFIDERRCWEKSVGKCEFSSVEAKSSP